MGRALEVRSGFNAVSTLAFQPVTDSGADTTAIRNYPDGSRADLVQAWVNSAGGTDVSLQVKSPRMHDNVDGITMLAPNQEPKRILPTYLSELVYAQDVLEVSLSDPGVGNVVVESLLFHYTNLPGTDARLEQWATVSPRVRHMLGVPVALTSGATPGQYSGAVPINNTVDQFKANQDYAILGATVATAGASFTTIGITCADFGNLRIGIPASIDPIETRDYFIDLSNDVGFGCVPIWNAANKGNFIVDVVDTAAATTATVTFLMALLTT